MLAKRYRLTKNGSFSYIYAHGSRVPDKKVKLNYVRSKSGVKIGFSVSNKIGHAVVRNKVKRRMRAVAADNVKRLAPCQLVFIASPGIDKLSFDEIKAQMESCFIRSGLVKSSDVKKEKKDQI